MAKKSFRVKITLSDAEIEKWKDIKQKYSTVSAWIREMLYQQAYNDESKKNLVNNIKEMQKETEKINKNLEVMNEKLNTVLIFLTYEQAR